MTTSAALPVVVLISGSGSNLQALIDGARSRFLPIDLRAVISNEPQAFGLKRAADAGIQTAVLSHRGYPDRESYDTALADLVDGFDPELIVLAGFMRILSPAFVVRYHGRIFNIHPSLLPKYRGLNTHRRVLEAGDTMHGASVHFVTEELDGGPLVLQARVPVRPDDDPDSLAARVLKKEHKIYPQTVRWFAEGRLSLGGDNVPRMNGDPLFQPLIFDELTPELLN